MIGHCSSHYNGQDNLSFEVQQENIAFWTQLSPRHWTCPMGPISVKQEGPHLTWQVKPLTWQVELKSLNYFANWRRYCVYTGYCLLLFCLFVFFECFVLCARKWFCVFFLFLVCFIIGLPWNFFKPCHQVTSFSCLHWVPNQPDAVSLFNRFDRLKILWLLSLSWFWWWLSWLS